MTAVDYFGAINDVWRDELSMTVIDCIKLSMTVNDG